MFYAIQTIIQSQPVYIDCLNFLLLIWLFEWHKTYNYGFCNIILDILLIWMDIIWSIYGYKLVSINLLYEYHITGYKHLYNQQYPTIYPLYSLTIFVTSCYLISHKLINIQYVSVELLLCNWFLLLIIMWLIV